MLELIVHLRGLGASMAGLTKKNKLRPQGRGKLFTGRFLISPFKFLRMVAVSFIVWFRCRHVIELK